MPEISDLELERLRTMTAAEKISVMNGLWRQAWSLKAAGVRAAHPDWSPERVDAEVRTFFARESG